MKNHFVPIIAIIGLCAGCATTTTTRTLVNPETGEKVTIVDERTDLTDTGRAAGKLALKAAYDYVAFKADAKKQEAEYKRSIIGDAFGWQKAQQQRHEAKAEQAWGRFVELGGPAKVDEGFAALLERIRDGRVSPIDALGD